MTSSRVSCCFVDGAERRSPSSHPIEFVDPRALWAVRQQAERHVRRTPPTVSDSSRVRAARGSSAHFPPAPRLGPPTDHDRWVRSSAVQESRWPTAIPRIPASVTCQSKRGAGALLRGSDPPIDNHGWDGNSEPQEDRRPLPHGTGSRRPPLLRRTLPLDPRGGTGLPAPDHRRDPSRYEPFPGLRSSSGSARPSSKAAHVLLQPGRHRGAAFRPPALVRRDRYRE